PMLHGVYDEDILNKAPNCDYKDELYMENKIFYSTSGYRFTSRETYQSIGESIQYPYCFFIHERPATTTNDDKKDPVNNYKRRHWHNGLNADGKNTSYNQKTIMNFWNSQLDESGPDRNVKEPNQKYVVKTIYDPSPAGYKIPPPTAFSGFFDIAADSKIKIPFADVEKVNDVGWKIKDKANGLEFFFPSTGLRDMGLYQRSSSYGTWPAHSKLTFIATSGFQGSIGNDGSSCMLFSIDRRNNPKGKADAIYGTNNAYGFTLRPIRDHQHAIGTR
ncbi:MAG: fimbrillin family protein, partial [Phocaeicola sp.]|nr:fimbrillin family protein [Phocaeicola sp.]